MVPELMLVMAPGNRQSSSSSKLSTRGSTLLPSQRSSRESINMTFPPPGEVGTSPPSKEGSRGSINITS